LCSRSSLVLVFIVVALSFRIVYQINHLKLYSSYSLNKSNGNSDLIINSEPPQFSCAPWIKAENRTIILRTQYRLQGWEGYQSGGGYLGGEAYWTASLDYALSQLGFNVEYSSHIPFGNELDKKRLMNGSIYRIIVDGAFIKDNFTSDLLNQPEIMCKVRHAEWWQLRRDKEGYEEHINKYFNPMDPRRALKPYPYEGDSMSLAAFFIHSQVLLPAMTQITPPLIDNSLPAALLLGKKCRFPPTIIGRLIDEGFQLHVTCLSKRSRRFLVENFPSEYVNRIVNHGRMTPLRFAKLLRYNVTMVIGFGQPYESPTPLEALANGAAFIHPIYNNTHDRPQHRQLMNLGIPYVYNYELHNDSNQTVEGILRAARLASLPDNRFVSFIPYAHRLESVKAQVCANLIESDAPCLKHKD